jgi:tetratricopeptide (TPR) repeat protein
VIGYTVREVARALGLSERQVRSYARSNLLDAPRGNRNEYRFSFKDVIVLRAARELLRARIHPRSVRRALESLRDQLPCGRSLSELRIDTEGGRIVVRDRDTAWDPHSGQVILGFEVSELASRTAPFAKRVVEEEIQVEGTSSDEWYDLGHELEAVSLSEAKEAYLRAVELDPAHVESHVNLGRLLHEEGEVKDAEHHYRQAVAVEPRHPVAWYNLGVALEDQSRSTEALEAYKKAVLFDPALASAHYNLSRLYEQRGTKSAAIRHLAEYRRLRGK